jgi:predicted HTH domain antitoxin
MPVFEDTDDIIEAGGRIGSYRSKDEFMRDAINTLLAANKELRLELAVELYEEEKVSLARAAEIADLSYEEMKTELFERGIELRRGAESVEEMEEESEDLLGKA